ncbi:TM2 domain-containing protein [Bartonella sp. C271]|uniref:TM2 domain-containing protein n=1 Tax=Bartonella sp. C271 TaxID=3070220 RepID=UPI0038B543F8
MRGIVISQEQDVYLISGDDGKRYQFAICDWLGKNPPQIGDYLDFVCEDEVVKSVFPILKKETKQLKLMLALICWFTGMFGTHRFIVGKVGTGIVMLVLSLSVVGLIVTAVWAILDFVFILAGSFTDKNGNKITH